MSNSPRAAPATQGMKQRASMQPSKAFYLYDLQMQRKRQETMREQNLSARLLRLMPDMVRIAPLFQESVPVLQVPGRQWPTDGPESRVQP